MRLIYLFRKLDELIKNYSVIIEIFLRNYNIYYKGKYKNDIEYNIKQMNDMNNFLTNINYLLQINKKIDNVIFDNFIIIFNKFDVDKYNLNDINSHFYYHIDMKIYKICIEYYYYFKDLLVCIKEFCNKIQVVRNEIIEKEVLSLSSSSLSNNYLTRVFNISAINNFYKSYNKEDIIKEIIYAFIKNNNIIKENNEYLLTYNIDLPEITIDNIEDLLNSQTEDILKIIKLNIITKYELINEIIILLLLNLVKIDHTKIIQIKSKLIILDKYLNEKTTYDSFLNSKDEIRNLLGTINIKTIINYKRIIIDNFNFKSDIKKEKIIDDIINSLFDIRLNEIFNNIKNKISFNYKKKLNSIQENDIIIQIINKVYENIEDNNKQIEEIKTIILSYYDKLNDEKDEELISILILEIVKTYNNKIIVDIKIKLNQKGIYILEKYLNENNYYILLKSIDEIKDKLRFQENKILNNIKKIISLYKHDNNNEVINKFLYSFDIINMYDKNKIYYIINEDNDIISEIKKSNIKNKKLILDKIRYISYTSNGDDIEYDITKINKELTKYLKEIDNLKDIDDIKDLVKIYEIYDIIISKNLTDTKIKEHIKEIKTYNKFNIYKDIIIKRFKEINEYYKFDYDITKLDDLYIYKNYIYVIINLYIYLLLIKDNFNLLYTIIEKIKKRIELYKKINDNPTILFEKLNQVNNDKNTGVKFNNFNEIEKYLNNYL
jgi:hypothetical protein